MRFSLFTLIFIASLSAIAQTAQLSGTVSDAQGQSLPGITVVLVGTVQGAATDAQGQYTIANLKPGSYQVQVSGIGYQRQVKPVQLSAGQQLKLNFSLEEDSEQLDEVVVTGKTEAAQKREEPIKIEVIDVEQVVQQSNSLPQLINLTAGVKVRQTAGVASETEVNINGLQGNAIRFFKNGIPTDYLGQAFQLHLVPTGLISNVEIYKGVLPIELGADALGGAVNITTREHEQNHLTATYELGSFNSHIGTISTNYLVPNTKFHLGLSAYALYSDNDYAFDAPFRVPETQESYTEQVNRFHDAVQSQFVQGVIGLQNARWADLFNLELAYFNYEKELQHGISINQAFGEARAFETNKILSLEYQKAITDQLEFSLFGAYSRRQENLQDLADFTYNWYGNRQNPDQPNLAGGELGGPKSDQRIDEDYIVGRGLFSYQLSNRVRIKASSTYNSRHRVGSDPYAALHPITGIQPITIPSDYAKLVSGLGLGFTLLSGKLENEATIKHFYLTSKTSTQWDHEPPALRTHTSWGLGNSVKYSFGNWTYARLSFEQTTRLPEAEEYFGDNLFILSNPELEPERSTNLNLGFSTNLNRAKTIFSELNLFYRNTVGFIQPVIQNLITTRNENTDTQLTKGAELSFRGNFSHGIRASLAVTYQDLRRVNTNDSKEGIRTPNIPYFFSNVGLSKEIKKLLGLPLNLNAYANYAYVEQYWLSPAPNRLVEPAVFERDSKVISTMIPTQHQVDVGLTHKLTKLPLFVNVQVNNVLNADLYDRFRIQKPLRNYRLKLTYTL